VCGTSLAEQSKEMKRQLLNLPMKIPSAIVGYFGGRKEGDQLIVGSSDRPLSREEQEALSLFRHLRDQIDLTNSESELKALLNESEAHRRSLSQKADDYYSELLHEQHLSIVKKVRSRAAYVSFKQSAKFAAGVATRLLFL
jgi:hypothetical protein